MTARMRTYGGALLRGLADNLLELADERDPERLRARVLDSALAATRAQAGRVVEVIPGPSEHVLAESGPVPSGPAAVEREMGPGDARWRISLWGCPTDADAGPALDVVATVAELALRATEASRELASERDLRRRFSESLDPLRHVNDPEGAVKAVLSSACALVRADAAVFVAAGTEQPELAAQEGTDPLSAEELRALLPLAVRRDLERGETWSGLFHASHPLRRRGFRAGALAAVGGGASLGYLGVLLSGDQRLGNREIELLEEFADHAGAAMTTAVIQREVLQLSAVDSVTRLFNGRYFAVRLDQESVRAVRGKGSLSLAVLTLDGLAELRAEGDEATADSLLAALAEAIVPMLRSSDVAARIDDDELAIILPEAEGLEAYSIAERVRSSARSAQALHGTTVSIGVAGLPDQAEDAGELLDRARSALVWALRHGGDRAFIYEREVAAVMVANEQAEMEREDALIAALGSLAATVDLQQPGRRGHSERVCIISRLLAQALGLGERRTEEVATAGLLHDVGKVGLSDELLAKTTRLGHDEWREMRRYPEIGHRMLAGGSLERVRDWVFSHRERVDGTGYPRGISGSQIALPARIVAVADAYDAMVSERPYEPARTVGEALAELVRCSGTQFDSRVVTALGSLLERREPRLPTGAVGGS